LAVRLTHQVGVVLVAEGAEVVEGDHATFLAQNEPLAWQVLFQLFSPEL
jgi:hypothetical protein